MRSAAQRDVLRVVMNKAHNSYESEYATPTIELGLWLRALKSFFDLDNLPLSETERGAILKRDFTCEVNITRAVLLRCLNLIGKLSQQESLPHAYDENEAVAPDAALHLPDAALHLEDSAGFQNEVSESLPALYEALRDACLICEGLLAAPSVRFGGSAGLRSVLSRELERSEAARSFSTAASGRVPDALPDPLRTLAGKLTPDELGEDVLNIFSTFMVSLEHLRFIELSLKSDGHLKQLLPVFALVHDETRELLDLLENRALHVEGARRNILDALDGTAYAIRMELRKVFEHELVGLCALAHPPQVFARTENAHGLLRDCFQQSVVAIAQNVEPGFDGSQLFSSYNTRLEQSLVLRRDLWRLLELVRQAGSERGPYPKALLLERLAAFSEKSLRFLMYKDWDSFERFVEDVESAPTDAQLETVLHRFEAFLETLFGQINIRAVLSEHPFEPNHVGV
ncbi:MAG: hypothetical protein H0T60_02125 [Acidobacteria bacterium]|nr:hypothetical protein [Acidobacteriota bacterium]